MIKLDAQVYDNWKLAAPEDKEEIVAHDWCGCEIYAGDGEYWVTPDGEYVAPREVDEYMASICTTKDF